jgi:hypothetical protein
MKARFPLRLTAGVCRGGSALALLAVAERCRADGDMSGLAVLVFWGVCVIVVLWVLFAGFLCYLLRRQRPRVRFGVSGFVLLLPLLVLLAELGGGWLHERLRAPLHEDSVQAASLLGVPLPVGSALEYEEDGRWGRTLVAATPPVPVPVGELRVRSLRRTTDESLEVRLSGDQQIDGWHCLASQPLSVSRKNGLWRLGRCSVAATRIGGFSWPAATLLQRPDDRIDLTWLDEAYLCDGACSPMFWHGLQLSSAQGKYDAQLHLLAWNATTFDGESRVGPYRFAAWAKLQRLASGEVEIRGDGHDRRDGSAVDCVLAGDDASTPRRCASSQ